MPSPVATVLTLRSLNLGTIVPTVTGAVPATAATNTPAAIGDAVLSPRTRLRARYVRDGEASNLRLQVDLQGHSGVCPKRTVRIAIVGVFT